MDKIYESLGRIEGKQDLLLESVGEHKDKIRGLELRESKRSGILAGISLMFGLIGSGIGYLIKGSH